MNSQAVLEILITIAKQGQEGLAKLKTMVDDLGSSVSDLNQQDTSKLSDSIKAVADTASAASDSAKKSLGDIADEANKTAGTISDATSNMSGFEKLGAVLQHPLEALAGLREGLTQAAQSSTKAVEDMSGFEKLSAILKSPIEFVKGLGDALLDAPPKADKLLRSFDHAKITAIRQQIDSIKQEIESTGTVSEQQRVKLAALESEFSRLQQAASAEDMHGFADGEMHAADAAGIMADRLLHAGEAAKTLLQGFLALEAVKFFKDIAEETATLKAMEIGLRQVGANAGYTASQMEEAAKSLQQFGVSERESILATTKLISSGVSPEVAARLAKNARTLALMNNESVDQALESMIESGSLGYTSLLRRKYQLIVNKDKEIYDEVQKKLKKTGGKDGNLNQREVLDITYKSINSAVEQQYGGSEAAVIDATASKVLNLSTAWQNFKTSLGEGPEKIFAAIVDALAEVVKGLSEFIGGVDEAGEKASTSSDNVKLVADAIINVGKGIKYFLELLSEIKPVLEGFLAIMILGEARFIAMGGAAEFLTGRLAFLAGPIGWVIGGFMLLDAAGVNVKAILALIAGFLDMVGEALAAFFFKVEKAAIEVKKWWASIRNDDGAVKEFSAKIDELNKKIKEHTEAAETARKAARAAAADVYPDTSGKQPTPTDHTPHPVTPPNPDAVKDALDRNKAAAEAALQARKYQAEKTFEIIKSEVDMEKEAISEKEAALKDSYDLGLIGFNDYWDKRAEVVKQKAAQELKLITANQDKARKEAQAQIAKLGVDLANIEPKTSSGTRGGEAHTEVNKERDRLQQEITKARDDAALSDQKYTDQRLLAQRKLNGELAKLDSERRKAGIQQDKEMDSLQIADAKARHEDYNAAILAADSKLSDDLKKAAQTKDPVEAARIANELHDIAVATAKYQEQQRVLKLITSEIDLQNSLLDQQIKKLDTAHTSGAVSDLDFQRQKNQLIQQQIDNTEKLIAQQAAAYEQNKAAFDAHATGALSAQEIQDEATALEGLRSKVVDLQSQFVYLSDTIQKKFGDEVYSVLDKLLSRTEGWRASIRGAMADFAKFIAQTEAKDLAQKATQWIADKTGGKDGTGGIFSELARVMGGTSRDEKGTEQNPMIVAFKKGEAALKDALGLNKPKGGLDSLGGTKTGSTQSDMLATQDAGLSSGSSQADMLAEQEKGLTDPAASQGFFSGLLDKFTGFFTDAGTSIKGIFGKVSDWVSGLFGSGGGGGGGLLSGIMSMFSGSGGGGGGGGSGINWGSLLNIAMQFFADGGPVPGSGDGDTVPAMLTPGEFVITKDKYQKYKPLLDALHTGKLDHTHGLKVPGVAKFAQGGVVNTPPSQVTTTAPMKNDTHVRIINTIDPDMAKDFFNTPAGEKVLLNFISRNGAKIKQYTL